METGSCTIRVCHRVARIGERMMMVVALVFVVLVMVIVMVPVLLHP